MKKTLLQKAANVAAVLAIAGTLAVVADQIVGSLTIGANSGANSSARKLYVKQASDSDKGVAIVESGGTDYASIYHDGTDAVLKSSPGGWKVMVNGAEVYQVTSDGQIYSAGVATPSACAAGAGTIYYDNAANEWKKCENGSTTALGTTGGTGISASGHITANQSISNVTWNRVDFDGESFDTGSLHDTVTNNSRFTVPATRKYLVIANLTYVGNATGDRLASFRVNGNVTEVNYVGVKAAAATTSTTVVISQILSLTAGDYVEAWTYQSSGGSLNLLGGAPYTWMSVVGVDDSSANHVTIDTEQTVTAAKRFDGGIAIDKALTAGYELDISGEGYIDALGIGTAPVATDPLLVSKNQNASTRFIVSNPSTGGSARSAFLMQSDSGALTVVTYGSGYASTIFGIAGAEWSAIREFGSAVAGAGLAIGTVAADPLVFGTTDVERMRILSGGNIGVGTSTPESSFHVADGKYFQLGDNNAGAPASADCDNDAEMGRMSIDTTNERLYICNGAARGWDYIALTD